MFVCKVGEMVISQTVLKKGTNYSRPLLLWAKKNEWVIEGQSGTFLCYSMRIKKSNNGPLLFLCNVHEFVCTLVFIHFETFTRKKKKCMQLFQTRLCLCALLLCASRTEEAGATRRSTNVISFCWTWLPSLAWRMYVRHVCIICSVNRLQLQEKLFLCKKQWLPTLNTVGRWSSIMTGRVPLPLWCPKLWYFA